MRTAKLDTEQGRNQQRRNIERSREQLKPRVALIQGGDNFNFVCFGEIADLKLWDSEELWVAEIYRKGGAS